MKGSKMEELMQKKKYSSMINYLNLRNMAVKLYNDKRFYTCSPITLFYYILKWPDTEKKQPEISLSKMEIQVLNIYKKAFMDWFNDSDIKQANLFYEIATHIKNGTIPDKYKDLQLKDVIEKSNGESYENIIQFIQKMIMK